MVCVCVITQLSKLCNIYVLHTHTYTLTQDLECVWGGVSPGLGDVGSALTATSFSSQEELWSLNLAEMLIPMEFRAASHPKEQPGKVLTYSCWAIEGSPVSATLRVRSESHMTVPQPSRLHCISDSWQHLHITTLPLGPDLWAMESMLSSCPFKCGSLSSNQKKMWQNLARTELDPSLPLKNIECSIKRKEIEPFVGMTDFIWIWKQRQESHQS